MHFFPLFTVRTNIPTADISKFSYMVSTSFFLLHSHSLKDSFLLSRDYLNINVLDAVFLNVFDLYLYQLHLKLVITARLVLLIAIFKLFLFTCSAILVLLVIVHCYVTRMCRVGLWEAFYPISCWYVSTEGKGKRRKNMYKSLDKYI